MVRCLAVLTFACLGATLQAQMMSTVPPPDPLLDAAHCLASAKTDWLGLAHNASQLELGYADGPKSNQGDELLYLVDYTTRFHSQGTVFAFLEHGKGSHRVMRLEYKAAFRQSYDGSQHLELIDPQFGGIWTQDRLLSAVREVGFHTYAVAVADLLLPTGPVQCESDPGIE
jgi:hypothetical protein